MIYQINGLFELKTRQNEEMSSSPGHASLEVLRVCTSCTGAYICKNNFHWNDELIGLKWMKVI